MLERPRCRVVRLATTVTAQLLAVLVALVALVGLAPPAVGTVSNDVEQTLAVVNAGGGSLRKVGEGYRLTLTGVVPRAVWFSDRPSRDAGSYAIRELEDLFFGDDDPPNAALEVFAGRGAGEVVVVELSNPRYRARSGRLVFDAKLLGEDEVLGTALHGFTGRADDDPPARFGPAALFIDDASGVSQTSEEAALTAAASEFASISSQLNSVFAQIDAAAADLSASLQGAAGTATQAAYLSFREAANSQLQLLNEITDSINNASSSYPPGGDGGTSPPPDPGGSTSFAIPATRPGASTSAHGASAHRYVGTQASLSAITNSIPTVQQLLTEGDQALQELTALSGGTGGTFQQMQQQWETSADALMTALRNLANTATQAGDAGGLFE